MSDGLFFVLVIILYGSAALWALSGLKKKKKKKKKKNKKSK